MLNISLAYKLVGSLFYPSEKTARSDFISERAV